MLAGLRLVDRLGGNKSTGKGRCVCTVEALEVNRSAIRREEWEGWLERLDDLATYSEEAQP